MSHEIRTPMNGVLGMIEMLLATPLTEIQRNYASMVRRSGEHLLVIINDILDFSKIEAGKLTIEYINFNLHDLLDDIDSVYRPQAHAKGVSLFLDVDPNLPLAICGDPNRLRQIMSNLLGNAIKFTDSGEIRIRVRIGAEDEQSAALRFEVHDTGIGISREARSRIFEAFSQADNSTTRKYGGTGLGLAISKQLVELMGGRIGVENGMEAGSVFWFEATFDKRRVAHERLDDAALKRLRSLRTLLLDELPDNRDAVARQLAALHIMPDPASSAEEAVDLLVRAARMDNPYDIIFIDTGLRGSSGLALCASLKSEPLLGGLRIILLSSPRSAADPVQRREAGAAYQLVKPPRVGDLLECVLQRAAAQPQTQVQAPPVPAPAPAAPYAADTGQRARRRRLLLAEDNPVNVEVATAMLDGLGFEVFCARNGEEALNAVRGGSFEVVLMDCQMPVMDGFKATAEIRRHEQQQGRPRKLPIIAITANALQGDREACLAAGMDDYLSKPYSQQQLAAVIGRWIQLPVAAVHHHTERRAPEPRTSASAITDDDGGIATAVLLDRDTINVNALDNIRALSTDRGTALVRKVVAAYVDDTPQHFEALHTAIDRRDATMLRKEAHSLKSSSANVGADSLAQMCKEMEHLGRTETTEGAAVILTDMEHEFQAVRHTLTAILEKES
jgi:CheY-like chemotaxis protein/HPt (histidine-containing phosphotransfer) domain-containing protein